MKKNPSKTSRSTRSEPYTVMLGVGRKGKQSASDLLSSVAPKDLILQQQTARQWAEENPLLGNCLLAKRGFYNYDMRIVPAASVKASARKKLDEWVEDDANALMVDEFVTSVWRDVLTLNSVVSYWRDGAPGPYTLKPERCRYTNEMGVEMLEYYHNLSQSQIDKLPAGLKVAFKKNPRVVDGNYDNEGFKVLTEGSKGDGFARPSMCSVFEAAGTWQSLAVGETLMGFWNRSILRWHKLGHEIRTGIETGSKKHFWKKEAWDKIEKFFKDQQGAIEGSGNFDHDIKFVHPPVEYFKGDKWDGLKMRLIWWLGPVGFMYLATGLSPHLLPILRTQAHEARRTVGLYLNYVLNKAIDFPVKVRVQWGDDCFLDPRIAAELLKAGVNQGPVSLTTFLEKGLNLDPEQEFRRKLEESKKEQAGLLPLFSAPHGNRPGRPQGTPDPVPGK